MTCWDDCGYTWRAIGEGTSCTRTINDGTVIDTRMTVEVTDIQYDSGCIEPCYHQFDAIIKIYQLYDGDVFETLVYENVDTFDYNSCGIYYKYNEWEICFNDIIQSPAEVQIKISHKALCPDCTHPYICDCEDTIGIEQSSWTYAPTATNNPEPEWLYVELLEVESDYSSIRVEITIRDNNYILLYTDTEIIDVGGYIDISDSSTDHDWRVACNDMSIGGGNPTTATVQLCFSFSDSGDGSGSIGDGLVAAQYFDSTSFGESCGCVIRCLTENPRPSSDGKNTAPTEIQLDVHEWQGTYLLTKGITPLVTQTILTPTEKMQGSEYWATFMWDTELPQGEYMWVITCLRGPHDGSFNLMYIDYAPYQRDQGFMNGYQHNDFYSKIVGVTSDETYEKAISDTDTFGSSVYLCDNGHQKIKIKSSDGSYNNAMTTECGSNHVSYKECHLSTGTNLSFEDSGLAGWAVYAPSPITIERSEDTFTGFPVNGVASAKITVPLTYNYGEFDQHFIFTNCTSLHDLHFDYYVPSSSPSSGSHYGLLLQVYVYGTLEYSAAINTEGLYSGTITEVPADFYLKFKISGASPVDPRTIYIDNIRFTGGSDYPDGPDGRIVGGSIIRTDT